MSYEGVNFLTYVSISVIKAESIVFPIVVFVKCLTFCRDKLLPHTYCKCTGIARLPCVDITRNAWCGIMIAFFVTGVDATLIAVSYLMILQTIFELPSKGDWLKALSTCSSISSSYYCATHQLFPPLLHTILGTVFLGLLLL